MMRRPVGLKRKAASVLISLGIMASSFAISTAYQGRAKRPVQTEEVNEANPSDELEAEMRAKRAIKMEEKEYRENLERARALFDLTSSIVTSFRQKSALDREDIKKLDKAEKLANGIRRAAGGSEDDTAMDKPPTDLAAAVHMLGKVSASLKSKVEKTPKRVISAAVIDEANVLLELMRLLRTLPSKV